MKRKCDVCHDQPARYDTPTTMGPWAYLCVRCMEEVGIMTSVTKEIREIQ